MATLQLYRWMKTSGATLRIISGTSVHLSRTTKVPYANWIDFSNERNPKSLAGFELTRRGAYDSQLIAAMNE